VVIMRRHHAAAAGELEGLIGAGKIDLKKVSSRRTIFSPKRLPTT